MIAVTWSGKAVSENRRLGIRYISRTDRLGRRRKVATIQPTREYEEFVENLAYAIKGEIAATRWKAANMIVQCDVGPLMDDHNLLKPIADAVERSGLLANDRELKTRLFFPATRHKRGELDRINLYLMEA